MIIRKYYSHTTEGHSKDYLMIVDVSNGTLECHWGPIGGTKQVDHYSVSNISELRDLVEEKHHRRIAHGYVDHGTDETPTTTPNEFNIDVAEMIAAERMTAS